LAKDQELFTSMDMWEVLFAPSVTLRKIVYGFSDLMEKFGLSIRTQLHEIEGNWYKQVNGMHHISFSEPEEDDYLLLHIWSALTIGLSSGLLKEAAPYVYFDTAIPRKQRDRIMGFYKRCVQRHIYAHSRFNGSKSKNYLAKNPALCPKINSLLEVFPGAKIVYLVRSPLDVIPSYVSMMEFSWRAVGVFKDVSVSNDTQKQRDFIIEMLTHWYRYPIELLEGRPETDYTIVRYDDLVADPEYVIKEIYKRFGFEISPSFENSLKASVLKARQYKSTHEYSLEDMGMNHRKIATEFRDIFQRHHFHKPSDLEPEP
jgi:hypothetical protein